MKKLLSAGALLLATVAFAPAAPAADHREAPLISEDPAADINDVYVFKSPTDSTKTVLAMTVNPFISPTNALASHFSNEVRYRFNIDNTGDAIADAHIDFYFTPL